MKHEFHLIKTIIVIILMGKQINIVIITIFVRFWKFSTISTNFQHSYQHNIKYSTYPQCQHSFQHSTFRIISFTNHLTVTLSRILPTFSESLSEPLSMQSDTLTYQPIEPYIHTKRHKKSHSFSEQLNYIIFNFRNI